MFDRQGGNNEFDRINNILTKNKQLNFVDRIINKDKYPVIENSDNTYSTHKMSYANVDGKFIVYPNIILYPETKNLIELKPKEAINYAIESKEFIPFDKEEDAKWFSENYKKVWEKQ